MNSLKLFPMDAFCNKDVNLNAMVKYSLIKLNRLLIKFQFILLIIYYKPKTKLIIY